MSAGTKKQGFRSKQILAAPIFYNKNLMGVIQILNKKPWSPGPFSDAEVGFIKEIADVLGIAFYNQERFARRRKTKFDYLLTRGHIKEAELDSAWEESREQRKRWKPS